MLDEVAVVLPADCASTQGYLDQFWSVVDLVDELLKELRSAHHKRRDLSDPNATWVCYRRLWSFQLKGDSHRIIILHSLDEIVIREDAVAQLSS